MTGDQPLLCIGGPYDGQRVAMPPSYVTWECAIMPSVGPIVEYAQVPPELTTGRVQYRRQVWRCADESGRLAVWVAEGVSAMEVVARLLTAYMQTETT
jgi:hypothetical protein